MSGGNKLPWYMDRQTRDRRTNIYQLKVIDGLSVLELAERFGCTRATINQHITRYYQWLKNGCPFDVRECKLKHYTRPTRFLHIACLDIKSLKTCEFAHKASRQGYSAEKIQDGLASVEVDMTVPAIKEMTRKCRAAEYELGKPLDFRILRDDLVKVGIEGYGREYYFG